MHRKEHIRGDTRPGFGSFVSFSILAYFWIGTQPFTDLSTTDTSTNSLAQALIVILTGAAIFYALRGEKPINWSCHAILGAFFLWLLFSAAMAEDAPLALRNSFVQMLFITNASLLLTLPRTDEEFARLTRAVVLGALLLAYAGVLFLPQVSIHHTGDAVEPMLAGLWRGHYLHKNVASAAMAVSVLIAIYIYATGARWLALLLLAGSLLFLFQTGGKTSLLTLPAVLIAAWLIERFSVLRYPLIIGGLLAFNTATLGSAFSPSIRDLLAAVGIDATFTDRVDIWHIAAEAAGRAALSGVGLHTFWGSTEMLYGGGHIESWAYTAGSAHNGYLDTVLNIGLPGLAFIIVLFIVRPIAQIEEALTSGNDLALTRLFIRIWLFGLANACLESTFFARTGVLWFLFMVAVFGLQLQAKARLSSSPRPALNTAGVTSRA